MSALQHAPAVKKLIHVIQGDYAVTNEPEVTLTAILGSCVACCLYDPLAEVGGMNHFLLPGDENMQDESLRFGVNSMELLINGMLKSGASRGRLEAKLFGGGRILAGLSDVGAQNAAFAQKFLKAENIACVGASLGGTQARRVQFNPVTGAARQLLLDHVDESIVAQETQRRKPKPVVQDEGDVCLF